MADAPREAWITGIGIVSCLGEGAEAHWQGLCERRLQVDAETFAPYLVHPIAPLELDKQIPKKGDQRQMEPWQRIGTYAAGLALADAGLKGNAEALARMDMIVAAGGGERDIAVDGTILTNKSKAADPEAFLNERLMSDLRPTLFLAQLSNLLAGNISIVHGVTGSSRTFMGASRLPASLQARAISRSWADRTTASARTCCCSMMPADTCCGRRSGRSGNGESAAAWCSARSARFSCSKRAATPKRAMPNRWRASRRRSPNARAVLPARSARRSRACGGVSSPGSSPGGWP
jgi:hypothetical protein